MKNKFLVGIFIFLSINMSLSALTLYKNDVTASYYAEKFHGKRTSNGEIFNMNDLTCAHESLPSDTILKVTNLSNGKSVQVRVNDRGPFVAGREIDLSKAAAKKIGMITSGTAKVKIQIVKMGKNDKLSQQTAKSAAKMMEKIEPKKQVQINPNKMYEIQIGSYSVKDNATKVGQKIKKAGIKNVVLRKSKTNYQVVIKDVLGSKINETKKTLAKIGFTEILIKSIE
jgi:rare lipoprotein A